MSKVIYYLDIYNKLKDNPAIDDKEFKVFAKLYEWKKNDR